MLKGYSVDLRKRVIRYVAAAVAVMRPPLISGFDTFCGNLAGHRHSGGYIVRVRGRAIALRAI